MAAFREPALHRGYGPSPSGYRFVPYHHASPPNATLGPLKAYEPTRNGCPFLCGIFPCMCRDRRPHVQSYYDPLVHPASPFSSPPQTKKKRRASTPSTFLQRILGLGSNSESTPVAPARSPVSNPYPPTSRHAACAQTPVPLMYTSSRRRYSTPGHAQALPRPSNPAPRHPTQTPIIQYQALPEELPGASTSWYRPRASQRPTQHTPYPPSRSAAPAYTPQVASAVLPDGAYSSRRQPEPVSSRPRRRKLSTHVTPTPSKARRQHAVPQATYVPQISPSYQTVTPPPPAEDPIYFANHSHDRLRWLAPECRLPRPFVFKGRHFWSVAQAVAWLKAHAVGDTAMAREIKNVDAGLSKREFESRAAILSNAVRTPVGWVQGLAGVYKSVISAAFKLDDAGMRTLLLETGHRELVWNTQDWDWGRGGNRYGRVLMDVRSQLRQEVHSGAHREMENRMPPLTTHRAVPASSRHHHHTTQTVYPFTGYTDLRPRRSRSGNHHVRINPTPMVQII
ncbi:hypothetical protein PENSPDRAFT_59015 [Peniophora sp. CONT]|nr:hypothetical protein PENSPDRAFT_59015 [Peniophora sp. CONT]